MRIPVEEDRGPDRGGKRRFPLAGAVADQEIDRETVSPQLAGFRPGVR